MKNIIFLISGLLLGIAGAVGYTALTEQPALVELRGTITNHGNLSYRNYDAPYEHMENPTLINSIVFLRYDNNESVTKAKVGAYIVEGELITKDIGDSETVIELKVSNIRAEDS